MTLDQGHRLLLALGRDPHEREQRAVDHGIGRGAHGRLVRSALDGGEPGTPEEVAYVLVVPEDERTDGALARRRSRPGWEQGPQGGAHMPGVVLDPLPACEREVAAGCEQAADGAEGGQRLVEEHDPELADGEVEGLFLKGPCLYVHLQKVHVGDAGHVRPAPCQLEQRG